MTTKLKVKWKSLNFMVRILMILASAGSLLAVPIMSLSGLAQATELIALESGAPVPSNQIPSKDSTVNVSDPEISLNIADTTNNLNPNSVTAKVNGNGIQATFQFKGHWEYDSCGDRYYIIESYKEGIVSIKTTGLQDGLNNVEISIADISGNVLTETWSFYVAEPPKISNFSPTDKSENATINKVSAVINDNTSVDWSSIRFIIGNNSVAATSYEESTNTATYVYDFPAGNNIVKVEAKDKTGNLATGEWSFYAGGPPIASNWQPVKDSTVTVSNPKISLSVADTNNNLDPGSLTAILDNSGPVQATFQFKGHWQQDSCNGRYYVIESYKEGTISFNTIGLKDGTHEVKVSIADVIGNVMTETWQFTVAEGPKISSLSPDENSENPATNKVSAIITDNNSVDWNTIKLSIDGGTTIIPEVNESTNTATYNYEFKTGSHTVKLEAKDEAENLSTKTWSFLVDTLAPEISYLYDFKDGMTITNGKLKVRLGLRDLVDIKDNASLSLDGKPINSSFRYKGYRDTCGEYVIQSYKEAIVEYDNIVKNGTHTLTLYIEDKLGNNKNYTWSFMVSTKPVISEQAPLKYGETNLKATISANVKSINESIAQDSIVLKINGNIVDHIYDASVGKVTYTPESNLANENYYTVNLTVSDTTNISSTSTWKFYTNNYPDMSDENISNCTSCHLLASSAYFNGDFESIHGKRLSFGGSHSANDCGNCHSYISQPADCAQCHGDEDFDYAPHGSTPQIKYAATNYDLNFPLRIKENREMWDCVICHQPGAGTKGYGGRLLNNHDIPELHKTTTENYDNCNKCHALSLTREHVREGRVDQNGNAITCKTCHENPNFKPVIDANKKDCASCHTKVDHQAVHTYSGLDSSCMTSGCHNNVLSNEHSNRGISCEGCHSASTNSSYTPDFKQGIASAITWSQLSCSDCHSGTTKHGITLGKTIPDALKYKPTEGSLEWLNPKALSFWQKESWVPEDMVGGLFTVTKPSTDLSGTKVFDFYKAKLAELGWHKTSGPDIGSDRFQLVFTKDKAKAIIRFYDGEHYDSSSTLEKGYRIEVLYK